MRRGAGRGGAHVARRLARVRGARDLAALSGLLVHSLPGTVSHLQHASVYLMQPLLRPVSMMYMPLLITIVRLPGQAT